VTVKRIFSVKKFSVKRFSSAVEKFLIQLISAKTSGLFPFWFFPIVMNANGAADFPSKKRFYQLIC